MELEQLTDEQVFSEAMRRKVFKKEEIMVQSAQHIANGLSTVETGKVMNISHRTVEAYVETLRVAYDAINRTHLIAILLRAGKIK
jgi:DNA-binding CsgD family transcriptional regulator